jgi:hypothetical protein
MSTVPGFFQGGLAVCKFWCQFIERTNWPVARRTGIGGFLVAPDYTKERFNIK